MHSQEVDAVVDVWSIKYHILLHRIMSFL